MFPVITCSSCCFNDMNVYLPLLIKVKGLLLGHAITCQGQPKLAVGVYWKLDIQQDNNRWNLMSIRVEEEPNSFQLFFS